jgi:hypothetical protein
MALTRPRYSQIYDTDYKQSVRLATTADVGNLLISGNVTSSVDGQTVVANDRILVKDQSDPKQNGIYIVRTVGTGTNGTWERTLDADANDKVTSGMNTIVTAGTNYSGTTWKLTTPDPIVLGTTSLTFINPFQQATPGAAGSGTQVQYNTSGQLTGNPAFTFDDTANILTVTGNITSTSGYFLGNGSQLTGITTDATSIQSGSSNVKSYSSGNIAVSISGISNVAVFTTSNIVVSGVSTSGLILSTRSGSAIRAENGSIFSGQNGTFVNAVLTNSLNAYTGSNVSLSSIYNFNNVNNIWSSNVYTTNSVSVGGNLTVAGNLVVTGNLVYLDVDNIVTQDALLYVADGNQYDFLDIGIIGNYTKNSTYQHGGIVRDASDSIWKFFANVAANPTTVVDFGSATYDAILAGNILSTGNVVVSGNLRLSSGISINGDNGVSGQYLVSTGSTVGWATPQQDQIVNDTDIVTASGTGYVNVEIGGNLISSFTGDSTTFTGNIFASGFANINITSGSADSALQIVGNVAKGGAGYHDFLRVTSTAGGATNISKHFRLDSTGNLQIINSAYSSVLLGLTDAGQLLIGSSLASTSTTTGALVVTGGVGVGGNLFVGGALTESSSATLKENITPINGALDLILQLTGVIYDRQDGSRKNEAGLIAEEVNKVLPNLITLDDQGTPMGVQYTKLTAYLIEAVKSLKAEIDQLKKRD